MFLGRGTHITRDMCFLGGEHISLAICVYHVGKHISPSDMCFLGWEHISLGICVSQLGEHISLGICVC